MERSVLEMLSDRSSAPTLLGCRPSACKSLGCSQIRFQLLTKRSFLFLHHDNNHLFKANSLLNPSCPHRYMGRGPDTMIIVAGEMLRNLDQDPEVPLLYLRLPQLGVSHPRVQHDRSVHLTLSLPFRIAGICAETSKTRALGKQWLCTLPSANVAWSCRTIESPTITVSHSISRRGVKRLRVEISKTGSGGGEEVIARGLDHICMVSWRRSEGHLGRSCPGCTGSVQRNTRTRDGGSVSSTLHTYPGLVSVSPGCFKRCSPLPQLGLLPKQLTDLLLYGLQLQLHRMQLERVLTCTQR